MPAIFPIDWNSLSTLTKTFSPLFLAASYIFSSGLKTTPLWLLTVLQAFTRGVLWGMHIPIKGQMGENPVLDKNGNNWRALDFVPIKSRIEKDWPAALPHKQKHFVCLPLFRYFFDAFSVFTCRWGRIKGIIFVFILTMDTCRGNIRSANETVPLQWIFWGKLFLEKANREGCKNVFFKS